MSDCPYLKTDCSDYMQEAQALSIGLAARIQEHFCQGDYKACSRYQMGKDGLLAANPDVHPWSQLAS